PITIPPPSATLLPYTTLFRSAYGAASLQSDRLPGQAIGAVAVACAGLHAPVHAVRGDGRGVARPTDQARDVVGLGLDELHVAGAGPDILGRDVTPLERFDMPPVRSEQGFAPCGAVVADDHAFPAAQVEPRHRGLVGHAAGQPEGVDQRGAIALVVPEARAAQRRPEHRGMNRDNAAIAGRWIVIHADLLVLVLGEEGEEIEPSVFPGLAPGVRSSARRGGRDRGRR